MRPLLIILVILLTSGAPSFSQNRDFHLGDFLINITITTDSNGFRNVWLKQFDKRHLLINSFDLGDPDMKGSVIYLPNPQPIPNFFLIITALNYADALLLINKSGTWDWIDGCRYYIDKSKMRLYTNSCDYGSFKVYRYNKEENKFVLSDENPTPGSSYYEFRKDEIVK